MTLRKLSWMYEARQREAWRVQATACYAAVAVALSNAFGGESGRRVSLEDFDPFDKTSDQPARDPYWHKLQLASFLPPEKRRQVEDFILGTQAVDSGG